MADKDLTPEEVVKIFYSTKGGLDKVNAAIDARLEAGRTRSVTLLGKFIRARLHINPTILRLAEMELTPVDTIYLAQMEALAQVEILDLRKNQLGDTGIDALGQSAHLKNVRELDLRSNKITRVGLLAFSASTHLHNLEKIDLRLNLLGQIWESKLQDSENFPKLKTVRVR
jgi:Ran GTPase-activating protein (RanGAP) involved in mRNA processing and transport